MDQLKAEMKTFALNAHFVKDLEEKGKNIIYLPS